MKQIKYNLITKVNTGDLENPVWENAPGIEVVIRCADADLDANLAMARSEAYAEPVVEDVAAPPHEPTTDDVLNALLGVTE